MAHAQSAQILLVARRDPQDPVGRILRAAGYQVVSANSASAAARAMERTHPTLVAADTRTLTSADREQLAASASERGLPLLTGWSNAESLISEVERVLDGERLRGKETPLLAVGPLGIDPFAHQAAVNGNPLDLTAREFDLLAHFARHLGWVYSRQELLEQVWGYEYGDTKVVTVYVANLRRKLEAAAPDVEFIETVRNVGYRLVAPADEDVAAPETAAPIDLAPAGEQAETPLYSRAFVGRETQLGQLRVAFDRAAAGQGSLLMVMGEPGIGKTALCEELSCYVSSRGGRTLWGHCYEEGSLSLPYLAFVEALRSCVVDCREDDLRGELGGAAAEVAKIVPEMREKLSAEPSPQGNPEEERYRLLQGVTDFLANMACVQPLLVVLEDLHDADRGTLDMLLHLARHLSDTHLLLVGTYRDVEVDRSHPLSAALAELRRLATYQRVPLKGLDVDEIQRILAFGGQRSVSRRLAEAVHHQTEGNPLFAQEVVRYLAEEGLLKPEGYARTAPPDTSLEMNIPEGLRDVIGKRLSLLGQETNRLISIASVIGREFSLDTLQAVANMEESEFLEALREAVQVAVLEERAQLGQVRYRFTHAFFRQTLYEELIAPQRLRLHQEIARALEEQYAGRLQEHASELAEHFFHSTDPDDLRKAVDYGEMAAKRAVGVYAYGEAIRLLDQTVKVQQVLDPEDKEKLCDLGLDLTYALAISADHVDRILTTEGPAVFDLAESLGDRSRAVRACVSPVVAAVWSRLDFGLKNPEAVLWAERIDRYADPDTVERAYADACLGAQEFHKGNTRLGVQLLDQAVDLARRTGDQEALWLTSWMAMPCLMAPKYLGHRYHLAEQLWTGSREGLNVASASVAHLVLDSYLFAGNRRSAEEVAREVSTLAERGATPYLRASGPLYDQAFAVMDGRLEEASSLAEIAREALKELESDWWAFVFTAPGLRAQMYLGEEASLESRQSELPLETWEEATPLLCLIRAHLGRKEEAWADLDTGVVQRPRIGTGEDPTEAPSDCIYLEAAVLVGHREAAELLLNRLDVPDLCTLASIVPGCVTRLRGGAAALLGRYEEARRHYDDAIKICAEMPFRPELALSRLELAELLLEQYPDEKAEALEHLDFAIGEFREMKMQPSLERALRHEEILKA